MPIINICNILQINSYIFNMRSKYQFYLLVYTIKKWWIQEVLGEG
jgi:hypothetical protein